MNGNIGDQGCRGTNFQTVSCDREDCEEFVEYDGDTDLDTDIDDICPEIRNPSEDEDDDQDAQDDVYVGINDTPVAEEDDEGIEFADPLPKNFTCDEILNQQSNACTTLFADECVACDRSIASVCPEVTALKKELDQVRLDMLVSQDKIEFYASKKRQRQSQLLDLHKDWSNYDWANSITQQIVTSPKLQGRFISACDINGVFVLPEPYRSGSVINVNAQMNIPPYASISIDVTVNGDCCNSQNSMKRTRRELGAKVLDHIKKVTMRRKRH